jgi:transposase
MEMSLLGQDGLGHPAPHVETLTMSQKERDRITIMAGVQDKELSQVQAAQLLGLSYRQAKRVWRRYQDEGDAGLVHRLRGKPGLRHKPAALRVQVLARSAEERYADFGPTLLAEELAKEGLVVDHDTLRRGGTGPCGGGVSSTGNGGSASRALGRWCNWMARIMTGLKGGEASAC